jgi:insertion element IS1 protein InsB
MANSCIAAVLADGKVVRIRLPTAIQKRAGKRSCMLIKNAAVSAASRAPLVSLARASQVGSKKVAQLPPFPTTLVAPDPKDAASTILELDELWSFVLKKANDSWIWIALCCKTRQVVAYVVGKRSKKTCQRLWEAIPPEYRQGHCFTDFLKVYACVIPEEQHTAVGKETGETAHVERWNNTLRQRLARFVRMTLSFSKSMIMHEACLLLFLHRYNTEWAILQREAEILSL